MSTFFVPAQKIDILKSEFKKIERKAKKLGFEAPVFVVNESVYEIRKIYQENSEQKIELDIRFVEVQVFGKLPVYSGWNLVASLEHSRVVENEISYNTVRMNPDYPENVDFRTKAPICEHCGHNRFRKNTYMLFNNQTSESVQVGSTCVKDFLGDDNPELIISNATYIDLLGKFIERCELGSFGSYTLEHSIEDVLIYTSAEIRVHGWISKGEVWNTGEASTAEHVETMLDKDPMFYTPSERKVSESINDSDKKLAKDAIEWMNSFDLSNPGLNDYLYNCAVIVKKEIISSKDMGIGCSIVSAYKRKLEKEVQVKTPKQVSTFVGDIKERLKDLELSFCRAWRFDSSYGVVTIIRLLDVAGNVFIWKTGYFDEMEIGTKLLITGTVKSHDIFKDTKQTVLTRCKWDYMEEI